MTRRPDLARACHQLERHGSGTPNDVPPVWDPAGLGVTVAQALRGVEAGMKLLAEVAGGWRIAGEREAS
jgi:hypothetical protein